MNRHRMYLMIYAMLAGVSAAVPQEPAPKPVPPAPLAPPVAPTPPLWRDDIDEARDKAEAWRFQIDVDAIRENAQQKVDALLSKQATFGSVFGMDHGLAFLPQGIKGRAGRYDGDDRQYERGQRALDSRNWEDALERFTQVASAGGSRADGALYWKAYALAKLGRRGDAVAAIAELRKSYATSRWLEDAKALELEVKQASGQPVRPEAESDEELKLMAINGLVQS